MNWPLHHIYSEIYKTTIVYIMATSPSFKFSSVDLEKLNIFFRGIRKCGLLMMNTSTKRNDFIT